MLKSKELVTKTARYRKSCLDYSLKLLRKRTIVDVELCSKTVRLSKISHQFMANDGDVATLDLISKVFIDIGIDKLTRGKRTFINFTKNC